MLKIKQTKGRITKVEIDLKACEGITKDVGHVVTKVIGERIPKSHAFQLVKNQGTFQSHSSKNSNSIYVASEKHEPRVLTTRFQDSKSIGNEWRDLGILYIT